MCSFDVRNRGTTRPPLELKSGIGKGAQKKIHQAHPLIATVLRQRNFARSKGQSGDGVKCTVKQWHRQPGYHLLGMGGYPSKVKLCNPVEQTKL